MKCALSGGEFSAFYPSLDVHQSMSRGAGSDRPHKKVFYGIKPFEMVIAG